MILGVEFLLVGRVWSSKLTYLQTHRRHIKQVGTNHTGGLSQKLI